MRCPICKESCVTRTIEGGEYEECRAGHGLLVKGEHLAGVMAVLAQQESVAHAELSELLVKDIQRGA